MTVESRSREAAELGPEIADEILRAIRRILRKTAEHSRQLARREGNLSVPQLLCLRQVAQSTKVGVVTAVEVATAVQLSNPTVSRILDQLESAELIVRERSTVDRRKVFLRLSDHGQQRVKSLPAPLNDQFLARLTKLPKSEQRQLLGSLQRVVEMMEADDMDAAPVLTPELDVKPH